MTTIDEYNPIFEFSKENKHYDNLELLNLQNIKYGMDKWYPLLIDETPNSYILELEEEDIATLAKGEIPDKKYLKDLVTLLIELGYKFMKTTHVSAHAFKPINQWNDFTEQITNARVVMSFRNYGCKYIIFRQWQEMNLECRCYIYDRKVKYIEVYRDVKEEFKSDCFVDIFNFVSNTVITKLSDIYKDFTVDVFQIPKTNCWNVVEINSPLWLKCGTYNIKYEWEKHRIHETNHPICRYINNGEVEEIILNI